MSLPPIQTKVVTLIIPDDESERLNQRVEEKKPKAVEQMVEKPKNSLLGNKRLYLNTFKNASKSTAQNISNKRIAKSGLQMPEPILVQKSELKFKSEDKQVY